MNEVSYYFCGIELDVEFIYYGGCQAQISGPPEDCYPAEDATVDIDSVTCNGEPVDTDDIYQGSGDKAESLDDLIEQFIIENTELWMDDEQ